LFVLLTIPLGAFAQTHDISALVDQLRVAEKSAQSSEIKQLLRMSRRALDDAEESSEQGNDAARETQLRLAVQALDKSAALLGTEPDAVRMAVQSVQQALGGTLTPSISVTGQAVETAGGLHIATFDTLQGTVVVNLPDDMAAGDTISGTVIASGSGSTPEEKQRNQDSLSGTVVEIEEQKTSPSDPGGHGKWNLPAGALVSIPLILRDPRGRIIGKLSIPVAKTPTKPDDGYQLPSTTQTGKAVEVKGSFDGDFSTTDASAGGKPIEMLAESPRKMVARAPQGFVGNLVIDLTEGRGVMRCQTRNLEVKLFAPKLNLKSGEPTTMTLTVNGSSGMEQNLTLLLINESPTVVRVERGDRQTIDVDRRNLTADSFIITRGLTGVRPGVFNIQASIVPGKSTTPCVMDSSAKPDAPVPASVASSSPPASRSIETIPPATPPATSEVVRPPVSVLPADDPEGLRTAAIAVHNGARWRWLHGGNTIDVFRDNPPMTGVTDVEANSVGRVTDPSGRSAFWQRNSDLTLWRGDLFFAGSGGNTFMDAENVDGLLGVAPAGTLPRENTAGRVRWHTGGLQLTPGAPLEIYLRRRGADDTPQAIGDAFGSLRLDPGTVVVGVAVAVIVEQGVPEPLVDRAMAELWFDGRTAGRQARVRILSADPMQPVLDRDPHPGWSVERLDEPNDGRRLSAMGQDPDGVWSYCGENFRKNIQFRLVRFARIEAATGGPACALAASEGRTQALRTCLTAWGQEVQRVSGDHRPALLIAIPQHYPTTGVAQAWDTGALVSQDALSGSYGRNTIAHEIGHVLGWSSNHLFDDGVFRNNLMSGGAERTLLREQCDFAYRAAAAYSLFPRP
jgi:hypothetical protein